MDCTTKIVYDTYDFFENIINYIESSDKLISNTDELNAQDNCTSFSTVYTSSNIAIGKNLCELFIKLYRSFNIVGNASHDDYKKEWHFLNYWLNFNISKSKLSGTTCAKAFSEGLSHHSMGTFSITFPPPSIYNIREDELIKMNLLYGLYENYRTVNDILSKNQYDKLDLLLKTSNKCCSDYAEANYWCNGGNNKFCIQLGKFRTKYEELYNTVNGKDPEYSKNFIKLTQCDNNTMSTALIGTTVGLIPLLVGVYKYRSNDDETKNIMLMDQGSEHISSHQGTYNIKYHSV
ncbi:PIR protein [Plasmodium vivax]|nr:PIR protein [Plasmodium vivax]